MKILLLINDLYLEVGGGQTVYKKIVESTPDAQFTYFRVHEPEAAPRPANCRVRPLLGTDRVRFQSPPPHQHHFVYGLEAADRFARSVAGQSFDIVELPDFFNFGGFIKQAFAHHGVRVGRFVLSLHGNISQSILMNWGNTGDNVLEIQQLEKLQFDAVDGAYGISPRYIRSWQEQYDRPVHFVDPNHFVLRSESGCAPATGRLNPALYCIGRTERRKGNDLFVELVRWLNPLLFDRAEHIGSVDKSGGHDSSALLAEIARARETAVAYQATMSHRQLSELFAKRSVVVLPVRYDSLNLVVLEALFNGCPVVISERAGACDYLDAYHPEIPYERIDFDNFYAAAERVEDLLRDYDSRREQLCSQLRRHSPWPDQPLAMLPFYQSILDAPVRKPVAVHGPTTVWNRLAYDDRDGDPGEGSQGAERRLTETKAMLEREGITLDAAFPGQIATVDRLIANLKEAGTRKEFNRDALREKLLFLYEASPGPLLRCNIWLEIARVERLLGNDVMAAAYELRVLRLVGEDRWGLLPRLVSTLNAAGHADEAKAAEALYGDKGSAEEVHSLLRERFEALKIYRSKPLEILDDRRSEKPPKVAVIVSLYKAADKLNLFLTMLCRQTLLRKGEVEVILVDSGSPTNDREVFEEFHDARPFSALYARSAERETIQSAWNRGIELARAPYLVFLGADEAIYPETLEFLARELDSHPQADWVMSNSLVTEVDEDGVHKNDVMRYDRRGASKDHVILETCYVSWVGGMYRASLHQRFGYYDEKFRGAGDTEFKNRLLPHIEVRFVDRMLGLFLNYPEGQTTASPMAEIEDSRAWYLFRTEGGVRYLFEGRPVEDAEHLLELCLGYRKSYCGHLSSDVELAVPLARYILSRKPHSALARLVLADLEKLQEELQQLEFWPHMPGEDELKAAVMETWLHARLAEERHKIALKTMDRPADPHYQVLNDNRFEQHSWLWKSVERKR